jgi:hypothetical protein
MTKQCANGHEILKGHAFCGACGGAAREAAEAVELRKSCSAGCGNGELLKAAVFCHECGEKQAGGTEEYGDLIKSLQAYTDARASLIDADLDTFPEIDETLLAPGAEVLKSLPAQVVPETGELSVDSMPLVAELLRATNLQGATLASNTQHLLKAVVQIGDRMGERANVLLKANIALATKVGELEDRIAGLSGMPRHPGKVTALHKAVPGAGAGAPRDERKDLHGEPLLLKASALPYDQGGLSSSEVEKLRGITNQGGGIPELRAIGQEAVAQKVSEVLARVGNS